MIIGPKYLLSNKQFQLILLSLSPGKNIDTKGLHKLSPII